jgi:hypothetical protein
VAPPASPTLSAEQLESVAQLGEERTAGVGDLLYRVGDQRFDSCYSGAHCRLGLVVWPASLRRANSGSLRSFRALGLCVHAAAGAPVSKPLPGTGSRPGRIRRARRRVVFSDQRSERRGK